MTAPSHRIFDRRLVALRRARAAANFPAHAFLVERVADEIADRLGTVNRDFPLALDLGSHRGMLRDVALPPGKIGMLVETDLAPAMLQGRESLRVAADEEALPFRAASFSLVVSALALHWTNDLPGALVQLRRTLAPDGLMIAALFGGETLFELRTALSEAEIECEGGLSPRISPMADVRDMGSLLQRAGFALPVMDVDRVKVTYADMIGLMRELRAMGETNALIERRRAPLRRTTLIRAAEIYQDRFGLPNGRIPATFEILFATGWAPHDSQQKPLKPGSATARLEEALKNMDKP
ncbi:MAG: methyltransferase domain-containing protein [Parvibaculaceae bacterium]|nr:methyltransferase domain-containing protein [Parvibaculaceae bacterium]